MRRRSSKSSGAAVHSPYKRPFRSPALPAAPRKFTDLALSALGPNGGDFEVIRGPGVTRWPASPTERRALASALWASCNDDERRLLARLALDGYAAPHPDNEPLVAHLRARGILRRDRLAFAEPHFRGYVRHTVSASELRSSASAQQHDAWNAIRVPLSTAALLVLGFVSYMQPELAALGIPISSALAAARPLLRMLGLPGDGG